METLQQLESKIEKLKKEHTLKELIQSKLPDIKTLAYYGLYDKPMIHIDGETKEDFIKKLVAFPATNTQTKIGFSGKEDIILNTPYRINITNPCSSGKFEIVISYQSEEMEIRATLPISMVSGFVEPSTRKISDSEHHYFIGVSMRELRTMEVRCYTFGIADQIGWYGGDKTLKDVNKITKIINSLLS